MPEKAKVPRGCVGCTEYAPLPDGSPCKNRRRGVGEIGICVFRSQTENDFSLSAYRFNKQTKEKGV